MEKFQDDFENWEDVKREFGIDLQQPAGLLIAQYDYENYEGSAYVVWREGDQIFEVHGGHCSCYGLEDQWEPEAKPLATFLAELESERGTYGAKARNRASLIEALKGPAPAGSQPLSS